MQNVEIDGIDDAVDIGRLPVAGGRIVERTLRLEACSGWRAEVRADVAPERAESMNGGFSGAMVGANPAVLSADKIVGVPVLGRHHFRAITGDHCPEGRAALACHVTQSPDS